MNFRLRTSKKAQEKLIEMRDKTNITPNILSRYAISFSLLRKDTIKKFDNDTSGIEFNRHVLTGKYDTLFKSLIIQHENKMLNDDEYFPKYLKAHLERGLDELYAEFQMAGNDEKFLQRILDYKI
ncbi:MAG: DNA sulfur modification protein DndE [Peptostreptococcaceae bacterium]|jgi:DNA sulfur modification protein DndE|nr:DNA sulfur modification protein DndE [Peptostreptococcaceae bacterium]